MQKKKEFVFDYDAIMTSSSPYALTPGDQPLVDPVVSKELPYIQKFSTNVGKLFGTRVAFRKKKLSGATTVSQSKTYKNKDLFFGDHLFERKYFVRFQN